MPSVVTEASTLAVSTTARTRAPERSADAGASGFEALLDIADSAPRQTQSPAAREPNGQPNPRPGEAPLRKAATTAAVPGPRERSNSSNEAANEQASATNTDAQVEKTAIAADLAQAVAASLPGDPDQATEAAPGSADQQTEITEESTAGTVVTPPVAAVASPVALAALTLAGPEGEPGGPVDAIDGVPGATQASPGQEIAAAVLAAKGVDPHGKAVGQPNGIADTTAEADGAPSAAAAAAEATPAPPPADAAAAHSGKADATAAQAQVSDTPQRASVDASTITADDQALASSGIPLDHARSLNATLPSLGLYATPLPDPAGAQIAAALSPAASANANPLAPVPLAGVAVEIASRALPDANTRFDIRLDPPELGRIDVRLDVDRHGHVTSRLVVERAETLDLLRREAGNIERALENAGLKTDANTMQFSLRDHTAGQRQPHETMSANAARLLVREEHSPDPLPGYGPLIGRPGGLDIRV